MRMMSKHREAALEAGALIVAIARCSLNSNEPLYHLHDRQAHRLLDLLHEFAFHSRKAIELAERYNPGIIDHARKLQVHDRRDTTVILDDIEELEVTLSAESLWWLLGRLIHSSESRVDHHSDIAVGGPWAAPTAITGHDTAIVFGVRSDRDAPGELHYFRTESVIETFLMLDRGFEKAEATESSP